MSQLHEKKKEINKKGIKEYGIEGRYKWRGPPYHMIMRDAAGFLKITL